VDVSYLAWTLAQGETAPQVRGQAGVRWVHSVRDVVAAVQEIRRGTLTWGDYLHSVRGGAEHAVLAPDDPLPALMEIPLHAHRFWKRIRRG
jgi:predicted ATP-grasp superfamily ATP-dependent carboligase